MTSPEARHRRLDPAIDFLNHGSFGAGPTAVLARQQELRDELERQPVQFMTRALEPLLDAARQALAGFVGADRDGLVFVPNATTGVNTVLRSLAFAAQDEAALDLPGGSIEGLGGAYGALEDEARAPVVYATVVQTADNDSLRTIVQYFLYFYANTWGATKILS